MNTPPIRHQTPTRGPDFPARAFFFYGEPKTGKTTAAAAFPKPWILNTLSENGTSEIAGDVTDIASLADLQAALHWFRSDLPHHGYQTIVFDGLTTFVTDAVIRQNSKDT